MTDAATEKEYSSKVSTYWTYLLCTVDSTRRREKTSIFVTSQRTSAAASLCGRPHHGRYFLFLPLLFPSSLLTPLTHLYDCCSLHFEGGNGLKSFQAKQKNAAKLQPQKSAGGGKAGITERTASSIGVCCALCKTPFQSIKMKVQLRDHAAAKHPKNSLAECFPGVDVWVEINRSVQN